MKQNLKVYIQPITSDSLGKKQKTHDKIVKFTIYSVRPANYMGDCCIAT